jgi:predicted nucleic acid-binding protein
MATRHLLDTDILVEYLRGSERARTFLESLGGDLFVSTVSVAELFAGVRGEAEEESLDRFLQAFTLVAPDLAIARRAGLFRREFGKSHGTGLADALIAASAQAAGSVLVTFNRRHFPMAEPVLVPYRRG